MTRPVCVVAVILALVLPRASSAQAGFDAPTVNLGSLAATGGGIRAPRVAVGANGNAVALFVDGPSGLGEIRASHYDVATRTWAAPATLATGFQQAHSLHVVIDAAGNATALWVQVHSFSTSGAFVYTSRYVVPAGIWEAPVVHSGPTAGTAALAGVSAGDGVLVWSEGDGAIFAKRFLATPGTWQPAVTITPAQSLPSTVQVAMDSSGVAHALWEARTVQTAALDPSTGIWGAVTTLSGTLFVSFMATPRMAVGANGHAVATWASDGAIYAARFTSGGGWLPQEMIHPSAGEGARAVVDGTGRITVAWIHTYGVRTTISRIVGIARFDAGAWTSETIPAQGTFAYNSPDMAVDDDGNVFIAWGSSRPGPGLPLSVARRHVSTGAWSLPSIVSETGQSAFNADVAVAGNGDAVVVWFQAVGGISTTQARHWRATPPAPTLTSVEPFPASLDLGFGLAPTADPVLEPTTIEYSLDDGATWVARSPAGLTRPLSVPGLVDGQVYQLRLRTVNAAGVGTPSAATAVRSGTGATPTHFRVVARTGSTLTFAWVAPSAGFVPAGYLIQGGLAGTSPVLAEIQTGGAGTQFTISLPAGAFFARVVATNGPFLRGQASNDAAIAVSVLGAPATPTHLLASASGSAVALSWTVPLEQPPATTTVYVVGDIPPLSFAGPAAESATFAPVPARHYSLQVASMNLAGTSSLSNAVAVTAPGTCAAPPDPPRAFSVSTQGGVVFLDWLPPATGGAVSSYVLRVSGAITAALPLTMRTLAVPAPAGRYIVSVQAVGLCGTSAFTPSQTADVP